MKVSCEKSMQKYAEESYEVCSFFHCTLEINSEGVNVPVALLVYSVAGNSYFIWCVPDSSFAEALTNI